MKKEDFLKLGVSEDLAAKCESASAEELKGFIPKARFDEVNSEKKSLEASVSERDKQLEELKKSSGDNADLKKQIEALQQQNAEQQKNHAAELNRLKLDNAVDTALTAAGAKNIKAVRALLTEFLTDAKIAADGTVEGLAVEIDNLAKTEDTAFLFKSKADTNPQLSGMRPGDPGGNTPAPAVKEPKDMTYDELCAYLAQNPGANLNN